MSQRGPDTRMPALRLQRVGPEQGQTEHVGSSGVWSGRCVGGWRRSDATTCTQRGGEGGREEHVTDGIPQPLTDGIPQPLNVRIAARVDSQKQQKHKRDNDNEGDRIEGFRVQGSGFRVGAGHGQGDRSDLRD